MIPRNARIAARTVSVGLLVGAMVVSVLAGCSDKSKPAPGAACLRNTDCEDPLSCTFGRCHESCREARDCAPGQLCVQAQGGNVCLLVTEDKCAFNSDCPAPLVCGRDLQCRNMCSGDRDCATVSQRCLGPDNVCVETAELSDPDGGWAGTEASAPSPADGPNAADGGPPGGNLDAPASDAASGVVAFTPSNIGMALLAPAPTTPIVLDGVTCPMLNVTVNSDTGEIKGCEMTAPFRKALQSDGTMVAAVLATRIRIGPTVTLSVLGQLPLVLVATEDIEIFGKLVAAAKHGTAVAGGFPGEVRAGSIGSGPGAGKAPLGAGGGGAHCGPGGKGGMGSPGGARYGTVELTPLTGGSSGGCGSDNNTSGAGGGALQIVAGRSVLVAASGSIHAGGGGSGFNAGAGAGGAILLEAPTVTVLGTLAANGGAGQGGDASADDQPALSGLQGGKGSAAAVLEGGDGMGQGPGGGGAGYIRINSQTGVATVGPNAHISPSVGSACTTQGTLK
jgi:hypothetical protein